MANKVVLKQFSRANVEKIGTPHGALMWRNEKGILQYDRQACDFDWRSGNLYMVDPEAGEYYVYWQTYVEDGYILRKREARYVRYNGATVMNVTREEVLKDLGFDVLQMDYSRLDSVLKDLAGMVKTQESAPRGTRPKDLKEKLEWIMDYLDETKKDIEAIHKDYKRHADMALYFNQDEDEVM